MENNSIEMKIAKNAATNWGQQEPTTLEEAKKITGGSERSSIRGIISALDLNPEIEQQMIEEVYSGNTRFSEDIEEQIRMKCRTPSLIIDMLSVVHDEWVKNNSNNFLRVNKDEQGKDKPRNKEYQFAPLQMLSWKEAKSDLLFLKPILEAAMVEVDEEEVKKAFEFAQIKFLIEHGMFSQEGLRREVASGSKFYSALEGLETKNGGNIDELLKSDEIAERMAEQIENQIHIPTREETAEYLIKSDNRQLDMVGWLRTVEEGIKNDENFPKLSEPASLREILLSKVMGKPYPPYLFGTELPNGDRYENEIDWRAFRT